MNDMVRIPIKGTMVDDFLRRTDEVHAQQRRRVQDVEAEYQVKRTAVRNDFARRMSDLADEGVAALKAVDIEFGQLIASEKAKLDTLTRMRG